MDKERFVGKNLVVTGGGSGIGRETALRFVREGVERVYIVDMRQERLDKVSEEIRALGSQVVSVLADVAKQDDCVRIIDTAVQQDGRLDILVSNAAAWTSEPVIEMKRESWDRVIAVNLTASFVLGQLAARVMAKQGGGVILYTASIVSLGGAPHFAHYNAAKAGIANLVETMAIELASHNIRVNCVSPGPANTQQSVDVVGEEMMKKLRERYDAAPIKRLAQPEDIAAAFAFLASDDASYITGHNLVVDGGITAQAFFVPGDEI